MHQTKADHTFPASQHLKHKKLIDAVFAKGARQFQHPVMAIWIETTLPENSYLQVGFSASKKHYKTAVIRNQLKRRMRESFRTQKSSLLQYLKDQDKHIALFLVMVKSDNISYELLQSKINLLLREIEDNLRRNE